MPRIELHLSLDELSDLFSRVTIGAWTLYLLPFIVGIFVVTWTSVPFSVLYVVVAAYWIFWVAYNRRRNRRRFIHAYEDVGCGVEYDFDRFGIRISTMHSTRHYSWSNITHETKTGVLTLHHFGDPVITIPLYLLDDQQREQLEHHLQYATELAVARKADRSYNVVATLLKFLFVAAFAWWLLSYVDAVST